MRDATVARHSEYHWLKYLLALEELVMGVQSIALPIYEEVLITNRWFHIPLEA
jgi:hypothetical protein